MALRALARVGGDLLVDRDGQLRGAVAADVAVPAGVTFRILEVTFRILEVVGQRLTKMEGFLQRSCLRQHLIVLLPVNLMPGMYRWRSRCVTS
jgi:hypothetical protein